ncbi:unnamed protein product [Clonostachys rosea]|uniref:Uncharacterized protein n=1 Tax=Bionectria ochroleuca TaxID=29856 RepID=A0ABY6V414_BIOOC|nr:unnamed protein product [Clonostachys rosea]
MVECGAVQADSAKGSNHAVAGAVFSDDVMVRDLRTISAPFPSVMDYEIPAFEADLKFDEIYAKVTAENTADAVWIDSTVKGTATPDIADCVWSAFDRVYRSSGRQFVSLAVLPFLLAPMHASIEEGGVGHFMRWGNKTRTTST